MPFTKPLMVIDVGTAVEPEGAVTITSGMAKPGEFSKLRTV
jgi:hypothetical protein